jgi:hypothetical protein
MSGPGDVGGEVSGEEAAWRQLVAQYDLTVGQDVDNPPWPERESLPEPGRRQARSSIAPDGAGRDGVQDAMGQDGTAQDSAALDRTAEDRAALDGTAHPGTTQDGTTQRGAAQYGLAANADGYFADRTRIIRHASDPRSYSPHDEPEDERFVPAPLPPLKLDPVAKAAWVGLIGGPAYLLIGVLLGWTISGIAAFAAIAAFVVGFVILVLRLGDGSKRDDDDDGAVV